MKCLIISFFVILITSQSAFSRTVENVLQDFQHAFDETHSEISKQQTMSHTNGALQSQEIYGSARTNEYRIRSILEGATKEVAYEIRMIMIEAGVVDQQEKIQHCLTKEQTDVYVLIQQTNAMMQLCSQLGDIHIKKLNNVWNPYYDKQNYTHYHLESVKVMCNSSSETADQMQECLINHIYLIQRPHITLMQKELEELIENNEKFVKKADENLNDFGLIAQEKIKEYKVPIIEDFRRCVHEVVDN